MHLQTISNLVENLYSADQMNNLAYNRLVAEISTVEEQVHLAMTNLRKEDGHPPEKLYVFNMQRLLINGDQSSDLVPQDELDKAEKRMKVYMRIVAENEREAAVEAGRICSEPGEGTYYLFRMESISSVIPPEILSR